MDQQVKNYIRGMFEGAIDDNWIEIEQEVIDFLMEAYNIEECEAFQMIEKAMRLDLPSWRV